MSEPDPDLAIYSVPETISVGLARRAGQHAFAAAVAEAVTALGASVLGWTVDLLGGVHLSVRLGGGSVRVFEFVATPAQQAAVKAALLARVTAMEAHVS